MPGKFSHLIQTPDPEENILVCLQEFWLTCCHEEMTEDYT